MQRQKITKKYVILKKAKAFITDNQIQRYNSELKLMFGQSRLSNKKK